jgi:ribosomal protein S18 acetylase RimI-like enzyme
MTVSTAFQRAIACWRKSRRFWTSCSFEPPVAKMNLTSDSDSQRGSTAGDSSQPARACLPAGVIAGAEPELHRVYVDLERKRAGIGSALMRELHARLLPGSSYMLLVVEANTGARAFYERHGLTVERRVDGPNIYSTALRLDLDSPPPVAGALLMRFTKEG